MCAYGPVTNDNTRSSLMDFELDILDAVEAKPAIVRIERTALPSFSDGLIATTKLIETTDIVSTLYSAA